MKNNCDVLLTEDEGSLIVLTELLTDILSTYIFYDYVFTYDVHAVNKWTSTWNIFVKSLKIEQKVRTKMFAG